MPKSAYRIALWIALASFWLCALAAPQKAAARAKFVLAEGQTKIVKLVPGRPLTVRASNLLPVESFFFFTIWGQKDGKSYLLFDSNSIRAHFGASRTRRKDMEHFKEVSVTCEKGQLRFVVHQDDY